MDTTVRTNRVGSHEEEYFLKLEAERLEERRIEADRALAASQLALALDRPNSEWMTRLVGLGITAENAAAFRVMPLVEVAWADGAVDSAERTRLLQGARRLGLVPGAAAQNLLESWLEARPNRALIDAWHELAAEDQQRGVSSDERWRLLQDAEAVAGASGGLLGIAAVSAAERTTLAAIRSSLGGSAALNG